MADRKQWKLDNPNLPEDLHVIRDIFLDTNDRKRAETLHQYLTRKGITCGCKLCRHKRLLEKNTKLL